MHGKAFLVGDRSHGVVAGSSNFTYAGLASNVELNLGNYSPHVVGQVQEWFDELWDEAVDYDLAALYEARFEPHLPLSDLPADAVGAVRRRAGGRGRGGGRTRRSI